jgi:3-oxoacyl-[acyl-carrier protein] reductase
VKDLTARVAIVTGSSSGVGAATARLLASLGCNIVVNYNSNAEGGNQVAEECRAQGVECLVAGGSVAEDSVCQSIVAGAIEKWGRVDILVNNAGTTKFVDHADLDGLDSDDFQRIYAVNVIGNYQMIRAVNTHMQRQEEGGEVVNVASTAAITGIGSSVAYAASKGALITMTLSLARSLAPKLREGLGDEKYAESMAYQMANSVLGVVATPETVADAIIHFITGPQIVTGETLIVDGGRHLTQTPLTRR